MFKPLCGIFNQSNYSQSRYMPIEIELEPADNDAHFITNLNNLSNATDASVSWRTQSCQIKCDILSIDNSMEIHM